MRVYADNAATTRVSKTALDAMMPYFTEVYGNPSSLHTFGQEAKEALENARERIAAHLGCQPREIYFTSGGSEADNQAIISAAKLGERKGKKHIISTAFEHHAVLHTLKKLEKQGFEITLLPVHENGVVDVKELEAAIKDETILVTVMTVNNEIGTIQPIAEIGKLCHDKGVLFHTDAVQAVGHVKIDVKEQNIDMLSLSGHKFHATKGIGALYCKKGIRLPNLIEGGAQESGRRAGTENIPGIVGYAKACEIAKANMDNHIETLTKLRTKLIDGILEKIPYTKVNGSLEHRLPGNVNFSFEFIEGEGILLMLDMLGIAASSGSACTSGSLDPSHVLLAIGLPHEIAHGSLRLTLSEENTEEEIDYALSVMREVIPMLQKYTRR